MTALATKATAPAGVRWRMHAGQYDAFSAGARTVAVVAGRRGGKSETGAMWVGAGARDDALQQLAGISWVIAPTYKLLRPLWRKFVRILPKNWVTGRSGTERMPDYLELGPARIEFRSADHPGSLVAEGVRRLWVDEAGMVKEDAWTESLLPTTIDFGAPQLLTGTPKGRNWFHRLYVRGVDPDDRDVAAFHWTSMENPFVPAEEVARLAHDMPERKYRQEILAEFLDDEGAVFRGVRDCVGPLSHERTRYLGVDLAKRTDFTVIHGLDAQGRTTHFERFNQISWPLQKGRIAAVAQRTGAKVILDSTGIGDPILDDLVAAGVKVEGFHISPASKGPLIEGLEIAIEQRQVMLPDEPVLLNELEVFEFETGRTGHTSYAAPEGLHDDCVIALALAWHGLAGSKRSRISVWVPGVNITPSAPKDGDRPISQKAREKLASIFPSFDDGPEFPL